MILTTGLLGILNPWFAVAFLTLPSLTRFNITLPVLVDQTAMMFAVAAALAVMHEYYLVTIILALCAGACHERAPLFAAIWAIGFVDWPFCLLPLVGLATVGWFLGRKVDEKDPIWLQKPVREALKIHRGKFGHWMHSLLPWGGLIILLPLGLAGSIISAHQAIALGLALLIGYGQLLVAQDSARLFCWAFLPMLPLIPMSALPFLTICLFNPYRGS